MRSLGRDISLASGASGGDWIKSPGVEDEMRRRLGEAGLLPNEIRTVITRWKANPTYTGQAATLSAELEQSAQKIYGVAKRLNSSTPH